MYKLILTGFFLFYINTFIAYGDLVWFVTYQFEDETYFMSAEYENKTSVLSVFFDEYIEHQIQNGNMLEMSKISCLSNDLECYKQGREIIKWKKNLIDSVLLKNKKELLQIAFLSYIKYFFTVFIVIFLIIFILKWLLFSSNKKVYITFLMLPIFILFFDSMLFYLNMHPIFFDLGFLIFPYTVYMVLFVLLYSILDLLVTKKISQDKIQAVIDTTSNFQ
jgi:hypothetical protein